MTPVPGTTTGVCECGHPAGEHLDGEWGPAFCVHQITPPREGHPIWDGVCLCGEYREYQDA